MFPGPHAEGGGPGGDVFSHTASPQSMPSLSRTLAENHIAEPLQEHEIQVVPPQRNPAPGSPPRVRAPGGSSTEIHVGGGGNLPPREQVPVPPPRNLPELTIPLPFPLVQEPDFPLPWRIPHPPHRSRTQTPPRVAEENILRNRLAARLRQSRQTKALARATPSPLGAWDPRNPATAHQAQGGAPPLRMQDPGVGTHQAPGGGSPYEVSAPGGRSPTEVPAPGGGSPSEVPAPGGGSPTADPAPGGDSPSAVPAQGGGSRLGDPAPGGDSPPTDPAPAGESPPNDPAAVSPPLELAAPTPFPSARETGPHIPWPPAHPSSLPSWPKGPPQVAEENILQGCLEACIPISQKDKAQSPPLPSPPRVATRSTPPPPHRISLPPFVTRIQQFEAAHSALQLQLPRFRIILQTLGTVPSPMRHQLVDRILELLQQMRHGLRMIQQSGLLPSSRTEPLIAELAHLWESFSVASSPPSTRVPHPTSTSSAPTGLTEMVSPGTTDPGALTDAPIPPLPHPLTAREALIQLHGLTIQRLLSLTTASETAQWQGGPMALGPLPAASQWVRDLTREGIESNPGPVECMQTDDEPTSTPHPSQPPPPTQPVNDSPPPPLSPDMHPPDLNAVFQASAANQRATPYGLHLCQVEATQAWFDAKPLGTPHLLAALRELVEYPVALWLMGDGLPNPAIAPPIITHHVYSHIQLHPNHLVGKHSVLFIPTPLPFDDAPPVFSLRSWCHLFRQVFAEPHPHPTHISVLMVARNTSPSLQLVPLLDKRFELDILKPWRKGIWVLPDIHLAERDRITGKIQPCAWPSPFPIVLHSFSNNRGKGKMSTPPLIHWLTPTSPGALDTPPESRAHHVLLNAPATFASQDKAARSISGTRLLMMLNCLDPNESSTQFRHSPSLRYPPHWIPLMQRAAPDSVAIAHYHVPPHIIEFLVEDTPSLNELGIRWGILGHNRGYVVNHLPRGGKHSSGKPFKCQADEILDTLLTPPTISRLFACTLALNRWDVYVELQAGVDPQALADSLLSLDNLLLMDAATQLVIHPSSSRKVVDPPLLFLACPPTLLLQYALDQVGLLTSVRHHQPLERPGHALISFEHTNAAKILAGCHIHCAGVGTIILTTGSQEKDTQLTNEMHIPIYAPLSDRKPHLASLGRSLLSLENVAVLSSDQGNERHLLPPSLPP